VSHPRESNWPAMVRFECIGSVKPKGNETGKRWEGNWGGKTGRLGSAACTEEGCELVVLGSSVAGIGGGSGCLRRKTTRIGPLQRVEPATNFA
jgi:hypothetical protein